MTLKEAIEETKVYLSDSVWTDWEKHIKAIKLGFEGLSYINECRKSENCFNISPLPGETKE